MPSRRFSSDAHTLRRMWLSEPKQKPGVAASPTSEIILRQKSADERPKAEMSGKTRPPALSQEVPFEQGYPKQNRGDAGKP